MKTCLLISGGPLDLSFAKEFLKDRKYDFVVAADAGFSVCLDLGIQPDLLVGDFDTFGREKIQTYLSDPQYQIEMHKPEKDETDTELAFRRIREAGFDEVDVLGALGGRLDHEISNIHLLVHERRRGLQANCYDAKNRIYILDSEQKNEYNFSRSRQYGTYVSFLPITEQVKGITLTGFKYPLQDKDISILNNPSLCVSNEILDETAAISLKEGILMCIESKD
ncbi:MAG: thiamine diphosphokinase [Lachnospiraceae bacterium]|nr:thiamine diphosphokinase [Lachnospiraceae bacterium]MBQ5870770.1 thiamine diphosphokinase [Lachnospiraceae bacterium]